MRLPSTVAAKKCDMQQGSDQNYAAMEVARLLNRKINDNWHLIQGICTDFQNWIFIKRDSGVVATDHQSLNVQAALDGMLLVASKIYGMLMEL